MRESASGKTITIHLIEIDKSYKVADIGREDGAKVIIDAVQRSYRFTAERLLRIQLRQP